MIAYPRRALAEELVAALQGRAVFGDAHNGLFLAAPRRTGKTTFLRCDLSPALERAGVVVVYVDLWADAGRDPATLIADAIGSALQSHLGKVARVARKAGLDRLSLGGWLQIDTSRIGQLDGLTLVGALQALRDAADRPVALIVDEAQQALTSSAGERAMSALKSARDQMNRPGEVNLMLVMSGSDRDKLMRLVNTNGAPFYGSQIRSMPPLGSDFIGHVVELIQSQRPDLRPIDAHLLALAFERFAHRPQFFMVALGQVLSPLAGIEDRFEPALLEAAAHRKREDERQMESDFQGLKPLEQAVLWRLLELGPRFRPYDAEALQFYRDRIGAAVSVAQAQKAIELLRQREPALVWKSARGEYALEDVAMHRWFEARKVGGCWPPGSPAR